MNVTRKGLKMELFILWAMAGFGVTIACRDEISGLGEILAAYIFAPAILCAALITIAQNTEKMRESIVSLKGKPEAT